MSGQFSTVSAVGAPRPRKRREAFLQRDHFLIRPVDGHSPARISPAWPVSPLKRPSCGFFPGVMPALATFGAGLRRKIAKVIKRREYEGAAKRLIRCVAKPGSCESGCCRHFVVEKMEGARNYTCIYKHIYTQ